MAIPICLRIGDAFITQWKLFIVFTSLFVYETFCKIFGNFLGHIQSLKTTVLCECLK